MPTRFPAEANLARNTNAYIHCQVQDLDVSKVTVLEPAGLPAKH